ncbi:MAG: hypothetical protein LBL67_05715 [Coriobacteriales bacterium]|jgi:hypothetical protein|nr:hypothetical protein [Coriobacteriales bacterium]
MGKIPYEELGLDPIKDKDLIEWSYNNQISAAPRCWSKGVTLEDTLEQIDYGAAIFFNFRGHDYFIERDIQGYLIQDPMMGHPELDYTDYPENFQAKTPEEMKALKFLDGGTIAERFDELRFFE